MLSRSVNTLNAATASNAATTTSRSGWRLPSTRATAGKKAVVATT